MGFSSQYFINFKQKSPLIAHRGYFDHTSLETIESPVGKYVIKTKGYPTLVAQVTDPLITFVTRETGCETAEFVTILNTWDMTISFLLPTWHNLQKKWLNSMEKAGTIRIASV